MEFDEFLTEFAKKYQKTTDGNWHVDVRSGLGMTYCHILTDKPQAMTGELIASLSEFGGNDADFIVFCHENAFKIIELVNKCKLYHQWQQRGLVGGK